MIFEDGIEIDRLKLKRGANSVDTHVFIRNDLWEGIEEIRANMVNFNGLPCNKSDLINMAIYFFFESLFLQKCDDGKFAVILDTKERYKKNLQRPFKQ